MSTPAEANAPRTQPAKPLDVLTFAKLTNDAYSDYPGGVDPAGGPREGGKGTSDPANIENRMRESGFRPLRDIPGHGQSANGFFARVWINDSTQPPTIIVANRGTDGGLAQDFAADGQFVSSANPGKTALGAGLLAAASPALGAYVAHQKANGKLLHPQFEEGIAAVAAIVKEYPEAKIITTGHSLGGGLAQLQAKVLQPHVVAGYAFDPPGAQALSKQPAFVAMAQKYNPGYSANAPDPKVSNWVINATHVGDTKITGPHIGGTQGYHLHTDKVVGGTGGLANTGLLAAGLAAQGQVVAGAQVLGGFLDHEFTKKHPAASIIAALGNANIDKVLGDQVLLGGLEMPVVQVEAKKPSLGEIEAEQRRKAGDKAGRLHEHWMNGEGPTQQFLQGKTFSPPVDPKFVSVGAAYGKVDGTVVGSFGGKQDGYVVIRTEAERFVYVPQEALAANPRPGQHVRIEQDAASQTAKVTPLREEPQALREARARENQSKLFDAQLAAEAPAKAFVRDRLGFDGSKSERMADVTPARRDERVAGTVVGNGPPGVVIVQTGEKSFKYVPAEAFGSIKPIAGKSVQFEVGEDGKAKGFQYDAVQRPAFKTADQVEAEANAVKQSFKDAQEASKALLARSKEGSPLVQSVFGGEKVQGTVVPGPAGVVLVESGKGGLTTYTAIPEAVFGAGKAPQPGDDVKLMITPDRTQAVALAPARETAEVGRGRD
jgi:hypothetical protein